MPNWVGVKELDRLITEKGDFLRAAALLEDEDLRWLNQHLDLAFEGRHDHLRSNTPQWVTNPPPSPKQHGIKRRVRLVEKSLTATLDGGSWDVPTTVETYVEPWCEACEENYCSTETVDRYPIWSL